MLSEIICVVCNDELTKLSTARRILIENQTKLHELLESQFSVDPLIKVENSEVFVVKEELVDLVCLEQIKEEPYGEEEDGDLETLFQPEPEKFQEFAQVIKPPKPTRSKSKKTRSNSNSEAADLFCPQCDKLFTRKSILRHHIASVHDKVKRFNCNIDGCEYTCYQGGNLTIHQRNVHSVPCTKTYFCETCGAEFK